MKSFKMVAPHTKTHSYSHTECFKEGLSQTKIARLIQRIDWETDLNIQHRYAQLDQFSRVNTIKVLLTQRCNLSPVFNT